MKFNVAKGQLKRLLTQCRKSNAFALGVHYYAVCLVKATSAVSQQIRSKTQANRDLLARVFPRLTPVT